MHPTLRHLLVAALLVPGLCGADTLERIVSQAGCEPQSGEHAWMLKSSDTAADEVCLFAQFPEGDAAAPFVRSGGSEIKLRLTSKRENLKGRWTTEEQFTDAANSLRIRLRYRQAWDSCEEGEDKCCGQQYEGVLEVTGDKGTRSYEVTRWSGG